MSDTKPAAKKTAKKQAETKNRAERQDLLELRRHFGMLPGETARAFFGRLDAKAGEVPASVHESGWQWRPVGDSAFAPPFGTIRVCRHCGCLVAGGPTACVRCAESEARGAMNEYKTGDTVRLRSGGTIFTVEDCPLPVSRHVRMVSCDGGRVERLQVPPECIERVDMAEERRKESAFYESFRSSVRVGE